MHRLAALLAGVTLSGCFLLAPEPPSCDVDPRHADERVGNAGCMVALEGQLLVVRTRKSGKLGFPAGYAEWGESAQCTAHRETWEEAGMVVQVGRLLRTFPNDFHLYSCELVERGPAGSQSFPVPRWAQREITEVSLRHPTTISRNDWRFPEQLPTVLKLFESLGTAGVSPSS